MRKWCGREVRPGDQSAQQTTASRPALTAQEWMRAFCWDHRDLVLRAHVHKCGASCWKHTEKHRAVGKVCRHNFFHYVVIHYEGGEATGAEVISVSRPEAPAQDPDLQTRTFVRAGKALRRASTVVKQVAYGLAGRVLPALWHPFVGPTNPAGLVACRHNLDVQSLIRCIPVTCVVADGEGMPAEELPQDVKDEIDAAIAGMSPGCRARGGGRPGGQTGSTT